MTWAENVTGVQHLGLPANDLEKTVEFSNAIKLTNKFQKKEKKP